MASDARLLAALRETSDGFISGAELAEMAGLSRSSLRARIEELRALGYEIASNPHQGYRLLNLPDVLHADQIESLLGRRRVVGRDLRVFSETTSTNDVVEKLARDGVKEGVVVFAECQTKGRGRLGRKWASPRGKGLWFSVLLRPNLRPQAATQLTIAAATAVVRAIRSQTPLHPEIKWPNDILIHGKKVAGVLTELSAELDQIKHLILGIGVDVNLNASDLPPDVRKTATSLRMETGTAVDRSELAASILRELDHDYARIAAGKFEEVADEWEERCTTVGHNVVIRMGDRKIQGRAESLNAEGALLIRTQHGHLEQIIGGDVTLEK